MSQIDEHAADIQQQPSSIPDLAPMSASTLESAPAPSDQTSITDDAIGVAPASTSQEPSDIPQASATASLGSPVKKTGESKPAMEPVPRKPGNLPAGASLADRIAALQKSSSLRSTNGRNGADRSVSAATGSRTLNGSSALHSVDQNRSLSSGSRNGNAGGGAVKDRIAKFQTRDQPLLPKSSFGSPAPMHGERNANALRPYPGANATGGGSGSWGEGVLRPQMTGGTWVGAGDGRGWQTNESIRPQLTGGAWVGARSVSPTPNRYRNGPSSPMRQRDAFLDLDEDGSSHSSSSPQKLRPGARRESSFSEAQLAAAQMGLSRSPKPPSNDGTAESVEEHSSSLTESREGETTSNVSTLYDLPEAPTKELVTDNEQARVAALPTAPSNVPTIKTPSNNPIPLSNDVEIGVANVTPEKMDKLRRTASGSYADTFSPTSPMSDDDTGNAKRNALLSDIQGHRLGRSTSIRTTRSNASVEDGTADIGRLIISSNATDDGSAADESPQMRMQDLPQQNSERMPTAGNQAEAQKLSTNTIAAPVTEMTEKTAAANGVAQPSQSVPVPLRPSSTVRRNNSNESGVLDPLAENSPTKEVQTLPSSEMQRQAGQSFGTTESQHNAALPQQAVGSAELGASGMVASQSEGMNAQQLSSHNAAQQAKQAITAARSKSQRVQRLPPGRMMSAAEMDASDDEYEPGWVSVTTVISSSRQG